MANKYEVRVSKNNSEIVFEKTYTNLWDAIFNGWVQMGDLMEDNGFEDWQIAKAQEQLRDKDYTSKTNYDNGVTVTAIINYK